MPLPTNAVIENNIHEVDTVGDALAKVVDKAKTKAKQVALAVAGSAVITKIIDMPADLNEEQMEAEINDDAGQYIPFPIEEVALDFEVLREMADNPERVEVLLVACRRENIETRLEAIALAKLEAKVIDTESFAMERAFELIAPQLDGHDESTTVAIMDKIGRAHV